MIARGEGSVPRDVTYSGKTPLQKLIDGDTGPPMIGVSTYPYSVAQKLYKDDFEQMVASTITHPYIAGTSFNVNSAPHDLLEGSALKNVDRGYLRLSLYPAIVDKLAGARVPTEPQLVSGAWFEVCNSKATSPGSQGVR